MELIIPAILASLFITLFLILPRFFPNIWDAKTNYDIIKEELPYQDKIQTKEVKNYHDNEKIYQQATLDFNDNPHGNCKEWYPSGNIFKDQNFKHGIPDGSMKEYFENGNLRIEYNYKNGNQHGINNQYYEDGSNDIIDNFKDGKRHGIREQYYPSGNLETRTTFVDGLMEGVHMHLTEDSEIIEEKIIQKGLDITTELMGLMIENEYKHMIKAGLFEASKETLDGAAGNEQFLKTMYDYYKSNNLRVNSAQALALDNLYEKGEIESDFYDMSMASLLHGFTSLEHTFLEQKKSPKDVYDKIIIDLNSSKNTPEEKREIIDNMTDEQSHKFFSDYFKLSLKELDEQKSYDKTKAVLKNMKFNKDTIREAVKEWLENEELAETKYGHISSWDTTGVTDMSKLFFDAHTFNQPLNAWDVSNVSNMSGMFLKAESFNQPLNNWDVSSVNDMSGMFAGAESFNQPLNNWDVSKVKSMQAMFCETKFNKPIGNWDVSNVNDMMKMFCETKFNKPIGNWDVCKVTTMNNMFTKAESFNQSLNKWAVSNVTDMRFMFCDTKFNQPIGNWDVSKVLNMSGMFAGEESFNQHLNNWDVSNVNDMSGMFIKAKSFNQPIGNWDVSNVNDMSGMFDNAESFNQSLEKWKLKKLEASELKFDFDINQWMTNNSSIKITDEFKLNNSENEFILIDYKFNGGDDFNFNIFYNETFEDEVYVGSPSSSELIIKVNNTLIYVKHFELEDGPIKEGIYLGISLDPGFKNIEWYEYDFGCGRNSDLIDIIGILSVGLRDEDFVSHYDEFDYYEEFSKVELNIQIDVKKLKEKWLEYIG